MTNIQELRLPVDVLVKQTAEAGRREADNLRDYLKNLPEKGWLKLSFCTDWTIKDVVEHQALQGATFRNMTRAALRGEEIGPEAREMMQAERQIFREMNRLEMADSLAQTSYELYELLEEATPEQLQSKVPTPMGDFKLSAIAGVRLSELSLHSWDIRVVDNLATKISRENLPLLFPGLIPFLPLLADQETVKQSPQVTYQFEIEGAVKGPLALTLTNGKVQVQSEYVDNPDVNIKMDADSFLRLSWGRLRNLDRRIRDGWVKVDGEVDAALKLNQLFQGI